METPQLQDLEQALLRSPFDTALRIRYGMTLLDAGRANDALAQAELAVRSEPGEAAPQLLAARALLRLQQAEVALRRYNLARALAGFAPLEELQVLAERAQPAQRFQLVSGQAMAESNVKSIHQVADEKIRFSSIVGLSDLKKTLRIKIIEPFLRPNLFQRLKLQSGGGILLYGPPGCGKTMLARALSNECHAAFLSVSISDILTMWLGESERNLAAMFEKARRETPTVLFFDELDALAYSRAKAGTSAARTVVNEFLAQLDGLGRDNQGVLILAATNMPWDVDDAMKRPGRFSRQVFVPPPDLATRRQLFESKLTGVPCETIDFDLLAKKTPQYSGADIDGLVERAKESAVYDALNGNERGLRMSDFHDAMAQTHASTLDWLRTVRNVVKYAGDDGSYADVERYLKEERLL